MGAVFALDHASDALFACNDAVELALRERRNQVRRLVAGGTMLGVVTMAWMAGLELFACWGSGAWPSPGMGDRLIYGSLLFLVVFGAGPLLGVTAGLLALAVGNLSEVMAKKRVDEPKYRVWMYSLLMSPFVAMVASRAFRGRRASQFAHKDLLALATGLGLLLIAYGALRALQWAKTRILIGQSGRWETSGYALGLLVVSALAQRADELVLQGLYPFVHWGLAGISILAAFLGFYTWYLLLRGKGRRFWARITAPSTVVTVAVAMTILGGAALAHLARRHRLRPFAYRRTVLTAKIMALTNRAGFLPHAASLDEVDSDVVVVPSGVGPRIPDADVILVSIDALRADMLGLYGSKLGLTPNIDRLFGKAVRFEHAYTAMPQTSYAVTSLMTGSYVSSPDRASGPKRTTIADVLRRFGYKTAAFYPPAVFFIDHQRFISYEQTRYGFEYFVVQYFKTKYDDDAAGRIGRVLAFLKEWQDGLKSGKEKGGRHFFIWVHLFEPHHPYQTRDGFGPKHPSSDKERYETEVAYADRQVGRLYRAVKKIRPNTLFVLTADHGEAFGDHDTSAHGTSLYVEQARVPLLMDAQGLKPKVVQQPVSLTDVAPTILSLLNLPVPASMEGADVTSAMAPGSKVVLPPVFSELVLPQRHLESVVMGHERLIVDRTAGTYELYRIDRDASETKPQDLDSDPKNKREAGKLLGFLRKWNQGGMAAVRRKASSGVHPAAANRRFLLSGSLEQRRRASAVLMRRPNMVPEVAQVRSFLEGESDQEVRDRLTIVLGLKGDKTQAKVLRRLAVRPDLPPEMLLAAANALARLHDRAAVRPLESLFPSLPDLEQKRAVLRTLGHLKDPRALGLLGRILNRPGLAMQAALAIGDLGDRQGVALLVGRLSKSDCQAVLRKAIVESLGRLGGIKARSAILSLIRHEAEPLVVAAGIDALDRIGALGLVGWPFVGRARLARLLACDGAGCRLTKEGASNGPASKSVSSHGSASPAGAKLPFTGPGLLWIVTSNGKAARAISCPGIRRFAGGRILALTIETGASGWPKLLVWSAPVPVRGLLYQRRKTVHGAKAGRGRKAGRGHGSARGHKMVHRGKRRG